MWEGKQGEGRMTSAEYCDGLYCGSRCPVIIFSVALNSFKFVYSQIQYLKYLVQNTMPGPVLMVWLIWFPMLTFTRN
jgi:hypothetical protein